MLKIKFPISYRVCLVLLSVFCITRIYRNSINHDSTQIGGIWNVIMILMVAIAFLDCIFLKKVRLFPTEIKVACVYAFIAVAHSFITMRTFSFAFFYNVMMLFVFPASLICVYYVEKITVKHSKKDERFNFLIYCSVAIMTFLSVFLFRIGKIPFAMIANVYYLLCLLPFCLFKTRNPKIRMFEYIFTTVCLLFAGKRAGFLAFILFVFIILFVNVLQTKQASKLVRASFVLVAGGLLFVVIYRSLSQAYGLNLLERIGNIFKDGGSGRGKMYLSILREMKNASIYEWIFGHGFYSTGEVLIVHEAAHNDFLETLYDFGVVPCILLIWFYGCLLVTGYKMYRQKYEHTGLFLGSACISLFMSMFSVYCTAYTYLVCGMTSLAVFLADWNKSRNTYAVKSERRQL